MASCTRYCVESTNVLLLCPFCRQREVERCQVEGRLLVVFPCMFSPLVDPAVAPGELQGYLDEKYGKQPGYFQKQCDRLHAMLAVKGIEI